MRIRMIVAILLALAWQNASCKNGETHQGYLPARMAVQFDGVLSDYLKLKDALVADNTWGAAMAASRILTNLPNVETRGLSGLGAHAWALFSSGVRRASDQISGASGIEVQRQYFLHLSAYMVKAVQHLGTGPFELHVQHCPMADAGRGGDWLSLHAQVQNPYFGVSMLHCGRVEGLIPGLQAAAPIPAGLLAGKMQGTFMHGCHGAGR